MSHKRTSMRPPTQRTLAQDVANQLLCFILDGHLKAGDRMPSQGDLAKQLEVGRSTVREAIRALTALGLVETKQGRGTFVKQLDARSLIRPDVLARLIDKEMTEHLFEARTVIEPQIAGLAAQRAGDADLSAIRQAWEECREARETGGTLYRLSANFHQVIAEAAYSEVLSMFVRSILVPLAERGLLLEEKPGYLEWELASHRAVYQAVASGDPNRARMAMTKHLEDSRCALAEMLP